MEIIFNTRIGGFGFSEEFKKAYEEKVNKRINWFDRSLQFDQELIKFVEEYGIDEANSFCSCLAIMEIPDYSDFNIFDYDGRQTVIWSNSRIFECDPYEVPDDALFYETFDYDGMKTTVCSASPINVEDGLGISWLGLSGELWI